MNHIEAMKQALEALAVSDDFLFNYHDCEPNNEREIAFYSDARANNLKACEALRKAIAEAEKQEPVAVNMGLPVEHLYIPQPERESYDEQVMLKLCPHFGPCPAFYEWIAGYQAAHGIKENT